MPHVRSTGETGETGDSGSTGETGGTTDTGDGGSGGAAETGDSGENMDAYLGKPLTKLEDAEELRAAHAKGDGIIFLKEKDARRNPDIEAWLRGVAQVKVGNMYVLPAESRRGM